MLSINDFPITWSNRPFLDLGSFTSGAIHILGIEYAYRNMLDSTSTINPVTTLHPISFRDSLIRETGFFQYGVNDPIELPLELRTERWKTLCDYLYSYQDLHSSVQEKVTSLLLSLCFHKAILKYVPERSNEVTFANFSLAKLSYIRAKAKLLCQLDIGTEENLKDFEYIVAQSSSDDQVFLASSIELTILYAKVFRNIDAAKHWRKIADKSLDHLVSSLSEFQFKLFKSNFHRAAVFIPLVQGKKKTVIREMDICQSLAEELTRECKNETERIFAHENLTTVFESRTKEALWLGDIDLAEERAKKMVAMEPLYSRYRLQLGEILLKQNKFEEAAKIYRSATRLGPPGMAIAWFMAGQCHERLGEIDIACDCYLASLQMDELAISAVEKINKLAPRLGNSMLTDWSTMRLEQLREQQGGMVSKTKTSYIPEATSALKLAGERELSQI
ncbi:MAG: tetratricopeptide repeat protein [Microcystis sp. M048S1]|uniref:tetratricopeptide repeat protein n=1 Tax=unclassified Microcystis TaxID=2643300 RepID=UPI0011976054|nr:MULTISPECIES: tetratricopeptide repeat protein [unclassified Microcystis]MCA2901560.1 tetratricopeptide repeat protein [Microcystis sp. M035S1]MCA2721859.1 tetratricopeptide repeat protein [Microcystis sp. M176S2]MCA2728241.1 tetratricopeptide repeat protein [Microcystis sp. M166S2]MCA2728866.1 tetratricopeptide repeat protein [Microcystis sp. M162S2]MCA2745122.1 tetratricopeptide repeat protein [Microcystis sp. M155S2]